MLLLSNSLLRSREYDADLHAAAQLHNPGQVTALLARTTNRPRGSLGLAQERAIRRPNNASIAVATTRHRDPGRLRRWIRSLAF